MICISKTQFGLQPGNPEAIKLFSEMQDGQRIWLKVVSDDKQRSLSQNALYFKWIGEMGHALGRTKDDLHETLKKHYALPILVRDDEELGQFLDKVQGMGQEAYDEFVRRFISTTDLNVKQFSEMLNEIETDARMRGIDLTRPDDLMWEAA